ncbi:MAG: single-stranded DNA-binding protein [Bdellovibrionaceae bacterium]|nr:single-stranded DNA-binding protein [Pseudobdellovibrionaceae bacterium]
MSTKNQFTLIGNVGQTPELKKTKDGKSYLNMSMAVNKRYKDSEGESKTLTNWFNLTVWEKQAEALAKMIKKGTLIAVGGELTTRKRKVGDEEISVTELKVDNLEVLSGGKSNNDSSEAPEEPTEE